MTVHHRKIRIGMAGLVGLICLGNLAWLPTAQAVHPATGREAPFQRMLSESDLIAEAVVTNVASRWGTMSGPEVNVIYSEVEFEVLDVVRDRTGLVQDDRITQTFLGGRIEAQAMYTSEDPLFTEGDHLILFLRAGHEPHPAWGGRRGIWRILDDGVHAYDGAPFAEILEAGPRIVRAPQMAPAPVPTDGRSSVREVLPYDAGDSATAPAEDVIDELRSLIEEVE